VRSIAACGRCAVANVTRGFQTASASGLLECPPGVQKETVPSVIGPLFLYGVELFSIVEAVEGHLCVGPAG
jgi:hypothetical protein